MSDKNTDKKADKKIETRKPLALKVGDHYHYTLSSYDPVDVTVHVPSVTDLDVEFMMENVAHAHKTTLARIDDAWIKENLEGASTFDEFKKTIRAEAEHMNAHYAEDQKRAAVLRELALRLEQEVPLDEIARHRDRMLHSMELDAQQHGLSKEQFLEQIGLDEAKLGVLLDEQAAQAAGQDAALEAYATHKKLEVPDEEIPALTGLPADKAKELIEEAKKNNFINDLRRDCRNMKAAQLVVGEAHVTYSHDTPEQAKQREEQLSNMLKQIRAMDEAQVVEGGKKSGSKEGADAADAADKKGASAAAGKDAEKKDAKASTDNKEKKNDKASGFKLV